MENSADLNTFFFRYFDDNRYIMYAYHTWTSQSNALKFIYYLCQNTRYRSCFESAKQHIFVQW